MSSNRTLHQARDRKRDEFYTQLVDIENEVRHYKPHFEGKVVYLNCDDPWESNFFRYFAANFNSLKLKKLIATSYAGSPIAGTQLSFDDIGVANGRKAHKIEITEVSDYDGDEAVGLSDVEWLLKNRANTATNLEEGGDFRSSECVALLEAADIVVTNPPFSLFREYVAQLVEHDKGFIILGSNNAITYKEIFPLLKDGSVWLGVRNGGDKWFHVPDEYENTAAGHSRTEGGVKYHKLRNVNWFTNLDHPKRHEELPLFREYNPDDYPHYDNYDAINVDKVTDIPCDWDGVMGVPITFLDKNNPEQFEIIGITKTWFGAATKTYPRQVQVDADGKRSGATKLNDGPAVQIDGPVDKTYYVVGDKHYEQKYQRILIRRRDAGAMK